MVNLPLSRVIGCRFSDFVPKEFRESFQALIEQGWKTDSKGEISLRNEKNELVPFLLSFTSLELDEGTSLSIILTDLSIQKENEKQLRTKNVQLEEARMDVARMNEELKNTVRVRTRDLLVSREHFKFLADNIPVIVWTTQADGSANFFNKRWYEYTGLDLETSQEAAVREVLHPDDIDATVKAWKEAIEDKTQFYFEYRIRRAADGTFRWHLAKGEPLKDEAGNVIAWFGTSTDIEDQKKELEKKDEFISVASHELRTPLTSLKGYIQLMEYQKNLPEDVKLFIHKANSSLNKLQHLIDALLDASKIQAGRLKFNREVFNLTDLINTCVENCHFMYPGYQIKKELEADVAVLGNEERLEQVLMNLINNAVKYSPLKNEIVVRMEKNETVAHVSVIDFGIGMSEEDQKQIFERFYRAEGGEFLTPGLGMGLYISSEIIKEHDGKMSVTSKLNEGSAFSFSVPLAKGT